MRPRRPIPAAARPLLAAGGVALLLALGCDGESADPPATAPAGPPAMQFTVDPALVGEYVALGDGGFRVRPPTGWPPLPDDQLAKLAAAQTSAATRPGDAAAVTAVTAVAGFVRAADHFGLIVSTVAVDDEAAYLAELRAADSQVQTARYRVNGVAVTQYLLRRNKLVDLRLLLDAADARGRRLQLDYVVPLTDWPGQARVVESSIGSLAPAAPR